VHAELKQSGAVRDELLENIVEIVDNKIEEKKKEKGGQYCDMNK
jgi:putative lipoic acid-binding regulatory protein